MITEGNKGIDERDERRQKKEIDKEEYGLMFLGESHILHITGCIALSRQMMEVFLSV